MSTPYVTFHCAMKHDSSGISDAIEMPLFVFSEHIRKQINDFKTTYALDFKHTLPVASNSYYVFFYVKDIYGREHRIDVHL